MRRKTALEFGTDGVAVISINNPPLNLLSVDVMLSLKEDIERALSRDDVKAIVITGSAGKFSAGFDVTAFGGTQGKKSKRELGFMSIQFLTDTLEAARKPFVAAIDGPAFGGGLEIALACHARISTTSAQLGLTELQYGILPGFGGTQRLPRLVGLPKALEMILMSRRINGQEAQTFSLVDALVPADKLLGVARQWALDIQGGRKPWVISLYKSDKLGPLEAAKHILNSARLETRRRNPNIVHPLVCIDVIEEGIVSNPRNALWKEAEALEELRQSSTCRSLVHFFFAQRQILKVPEISKMNLLPRKIAQVAVIGGGLMSSEIVAILLLRSYRVILKEKNQEHLVDEINRVKGNLQKYVKNGKATPEDSKKAFNLLKGVLNYADFDGIDLVIEAESENLSLKQEIFVNLEKWCSRHCIFASNSSTFSLKLIAERTKCQDRIAQIFFCLYPVMPLLEIAHIDSTSPQVIVDLVDFGKKMKKTPIVIKGQKGSAVNRMVVAYLHAAMLLAERGVDVYQIDQALESLGMQMGPFRMIDTVGFGTFAHISKSIIENFPDRSYKPKLISLLQQDARNGESNGKGFYKYDNSGQPIPELKLEKAQLRKLSNNEVAEMTLFPALNEAFHILSKGIVTNSSDLDVASVLGMGFPAYRGGIIYWSDSFGSNYVHSRLHKWSVEYGDFYKPSCNFGTRQTKSQLLKKSQL